MIQSRGTMKTMTVYRNCWHIVQIHQYLLQTKPGMSLWNMTVSNPYYTCRTHQLTLLFALHIKRYGIYPRNSLNVVSVFTCQCHNVFQRIVVVRCTTDRNVGLNVLIKLFCLALNYCQMLNYMVEWYLNWYTCGKIAIDYEILCDLTGRKKNVTFFSFNGTPLQIKPTVCCYTIMFCLGC